MGKRRRSFGKKKQEAQKPLFVGRKDQLDNFRRNMQAGPDDDHFQNIFSVYGQGGVGKSTLLSHFQKVVRDYNAYSILLDMEDIRLYSIPSVMAKIAALLKEEDFNFKKFSKIYKDYLQKRSELESDPNRPNSLVENIASDGIKIGFSTAAEFIPGGGLIKEFIPVDTIAESTGKLADFAWRKFGNREDVELALYPLKVLTPIWLEELYECYNRSNIVIKLDTYEAANPDLDEWFIDLLQGEYGEVPDNILLVFSGREKLETTRWSDFQEFITSIPLKPFSPEEAREYLLKRNITNEQTIKSIISVSGGLPVYLALLVDENPEQDDHLAHPTEKVVERFLRYIKNPTQKKLARLAALPRKLNVDICKRLLSEDEYIDGLFDWLKARPFTQNRGGHWSYHPIVRQQMLAYNKDESIETWEAVHYRLANYYNERAQRIEQAEESKNFLDNEWRQLKLEHWYHQLAANYKREIAGFILFLVQSCRFKVPFEDILPYSDILSQAEETEENTFWAFQIRSGISASLAKSGDHGLEMCLKMLESGYLTSPKDEAYIYNFAAVSAHHLGQHDKEISYLKKAIEIYPAYIQATRNLGYSYRDVNHQELSLDYFHKAVELDPSEIKSLESLGLGYFHFDRYEESIQWFDKMLLIDSDHHNASFNKARALSGLQKTDEAIAMYQKVLAINEKEAATWLNLGQLYLNEKKEVEQALAAYKKALQIQPDSIIACFRIGDIYRAQLKDYEQAEIYARKAIDIEENNYLGWKLMGDIHAFGPEDNQKAIEFYEKALELDVDNPYILMGIGITHYNDNNYVTAIDYFEKSLDKDQSHSILYIIWYYLGNAYLKKPEKDYPRAIECYRKGIEANPDYVLLWNELGLAYQKGPKNSQKAIECFEKAIEVNPQLPYSHVNLGDIYINHVKDYKKAVIHCEQAKVLAPNIMNGWVGAGWGYLFQRKLDLAFENFTKAVEINPSTPQSLVGMADYYRIGKQDFKAAIEWYEKAITLEDTNFKTWAFLGICYKEGKVNFDRAIECFEKSLDIAPWDIAYIQLGITYFDHKQAPLKAIECWEKATASFPNNHMAWALLGMAKAKEKNDMQAAIKYYQKAIELKPDYQYALMGLGWAYLTKHQLEEAEKQFHKHLQVTPDHPFFNVLMNLGHIELMRGHPEKAQELYQKAKQLCPDLSKFLKGMESDFDDLRLAEAGVDRAPYELMVEQLKNPPSKEER